MAEYVAKLRSGTSDTLSADLLSLMADYRENTNAALKGGQVRVTDPAEADAVADTIAQLRDAIGTDDVVTYHVCQHDQGIGTCTPEVR